MIKGPILQEDITILDVYTLKKSRVTHEAKCAGITRRDRLIYCHSCGLQHHPISNGQAQQAGSQ